MTVFFVASRQSLLLLCQNPRLHLLPFIAMEKRPILRDRRWNWDAFSAAYRFRPRYEFLGPDGYTARWEALETESANFCDGGVECPPPFFFFTDDTVSRRISDLSHRQGRALLPWILMVLHSLMMTCTSQQVPRMIVFKVEINIMSLNELER